MLNFRVFLLQRHGQLFGRLRGPMVQITPLPCYSWFQCCIDMWRMFLRNFDVTEPIFKYLR